MKKKILLSILIIFCGFFSFGSSVFAASLVQCGDVNNIPSKLPYFVWLAFTLIKYITPVLIIVLGSLDFFKAITANDSDMLAKTFKVFGKRLIAGVVVFLVFILFQTTISLVAKKSTGFTQCLSCFLTDPDQCTVDTTTGVTTTPVNEDDIIDGYNNSQTEFDNGNSKSTGKGTILLIAGHSYSPYCDKVSNECRPTSIASGYVEPDETRKIVKLIKAKLSGMGIEADIANELLADSSDAKMNSSFFVERSLNTDKFNSIKWSNYKYAIEFHFNASGSGSTMGTGNGSVILIPSGGSKLDIDSKILSLITSYTKNNNIGVYTQGTSTSNYFKSLGIPSTYLEVEFYDNKTAMDKYTNNIDSIAKGIAQLIKEYYK